MKILLDTNIFVHAYNKSSPNHDNASRIIKKAMQNQIQAYISPQVLYEFFSVVTSPKRVEHPITSDEAASICLDLWECNEIEKVNPSILAPIEVFKFVEDLKLTKAEIFDCVLAVTAKENEIDCIYTENVADFQRYNFVKAVNPFV